MSARDHLSLLRCADQGPHVDEGMLAHLQDFHAICPEQIGAEMEHSGLGQEDYHTLLHEADDGYGAKWRSGARPHELGER